MAFLKDGRWTHPVVTGMRRWGRGTVEDNFASEIRSLVEIFMREASQNPLDARVRGTTGPVEVKFRVLTPSQYDPAFLDELIGADYIERLNATLKTGRKFTKPAQPTVLIVEDFNTTGLEGTYTNPIEDGANQNWNAFWFREGVGDKQSAGSNGRAGQGKITFYRMSQVRAVFGYTIRASDKKALLMGGSCFTQTYSLQNTDEKYERDAYWSHIKTSASAQPITNVSQTQAFVKAFCLDRTIESGLSLVIPYSQEFLEEDAIRTVISDFYYAVVTGRLAVTIGSLRIDKDTIRKIASVHFPDTYAKQRRSSFTSGFRSFVDEVVKNPVPLIKANANAWKHVAQGALTEVDLPAEGLSTLREKLKTGEVVSVRFPIEVRPIGAPVQSSFFDIHLQLPSILESAEEAYIRRELLIGSEEYLKKDRSLPSARGLTLIEDDALSGFMADAEEPTHMKWNASRPRLAEDYEQPKDVVSAVRKTPVKLLALLADVVAIRDKKALASVFAKVSKDAGLGGTAATGTKKKKTGSGGSGGGAKPPTPKPFTWEHGASWDRVKAAKLDTSGYPSLPLDVVLEYAYLGIDDDAFHAYDPFDFDLGDPAGPQVVEATGCTVIEKNENKIKARIESMPFAIKVCGFSEFMMRKVRINFPRKDISDGNDNLDQQPDGTEAD